MRQRGSSARLKQTSHRPTFSLTSLIASARPRASCSEARRIWKANRWAVRLPIPGSLESSVTSLWMGGANEFKRGLQTWETEPTERAGIQAAGDRAHLACRQLLG